VQATTETPGMPPKKRARSTSQPAGVEERSPGGGHSTAQAIEHHSDTEAETGNVDRPTPSEEGGSGNSQPLSAIRQHLRERGQRGENRGRTEDDSALHQVDDQPSETEQSRESATGARQRREAVWSQEAALDDFLRDHDIGTPASGMEVRERAVIIARLSNSLREEAESDRVRTRGTGDPSAEALDEENARLAARHKLNAAYEVVRMIETIGRYLQRDPTPIGARRKGTGLGRAVDAFEEAHGAYTGLPLTGEALHVAMRIRDRIRAAVEEVQERIEMLQDRQALQAPPPRQVQEPQPGPSQGRTGGAILHVQQEDTEQSGRSGDNGDSSNSRRPSNRTDNGDSSNSRRPSNRTENDGLSDVNYSAEDEDEERYPPRQAIPPRQAEGAQARGAQAAGGQERGREPLVPYQPQTFGQTERQQPQRTASASNQAFLRPEDVRERRAPAEERNLRPGAAREAARSYDDVFYHEGEGQPRSAEPRGRREERPERRATEGTERAPPYRPTQKYTQEEYEIWLRTGELPPTRRKKKATPEGRRRTQSEEDREWRQREHGREEPVMPEPPGRARGRPADRGQHEFDPWFWEYDYEQPRWEDRIPHRFAPEASREERGWEPPRAPGQWEPAAGMGRGWEQPSGPHHGRDYAEGFGRGWEPPMGAPRGWEQPRYPQDGPDYRSRFDQDPFYHGPGTYEPPRMSREEFEKRYGMGRNRAQVVNVKKFGGKHEEWPEWIQAFREHILDNPTIGAVEAWGYLREKLTNEAYAVIKSFDNTHESLKPALNKLYEVYGQPHLIVRSIWRELRDMKLPSGSSRSAVLSMHYAQVGLLSRMERHAWPKEFRASQYEQNLMLETMGPYYRAQYDRWLQRQGPRFYPSTEQFFRWAKDKIEDDIRRSPYKERPSGQPQPGRPKKPATALQGNVQGSRDSSASNKSSGKGQKGQGGGKAKEKSAPKFPKGTCMGCGQGGSHDPTTCSKIKSASVDDRWKLRKAADACSNCMKTGHHYKECTAPKTCKKCDNKHHAFMHDDNPPKKKGGGQSK